MTPLWRIALLLCFVCHVSVAGAQDDPARSASARTLFEEGVQLAEQGQWESATDRFRRALTLRDSPVIRFNLAAALAELGQVVEASEQFRTLLRTDGLDPALHAQVEERLAATTPRIAKLTLHVEGNMDGARVELDGRPLPSALIGVASPVDPGSHGVRLLKDEAELDAQSVDLEPGASATLTLSAKHVPTPAETASAAVGAASQAPAPPPPVSEGTRKDTGNSRRSKLLWWGIGGGAALVIGAVLAGVLISQNNTQASPYQGDFEPGSVNVKVTP